MVQTIGRFNHDRPIPMTKTTLQNKLKQLQRQHEQLVQRRNRPQKNGNGIFDRYEYPVLTAEHTPLFWRYDLNPATNPHLMERIGAPSLECLPIYLVQPCGRSVAAV